MTMVNGCFLCEQLKCFILKQCKISLKSYLNLAANQNEDLQKCSKHTTIIKIDSRKEKKKKTVKTFKKVAILFLNLTKVT